MADVTDPPMQNPPHENEDDSLRELIGRAQGGDPDAVEELIERHYDDVRAFVRLQVDPALRARESSSDLVQSVCRKLLESLHDFEYRGKGSFRQWLFTLALNRVRQKYKYQRAQKRDPGRECSVLDYVSLRAPGPTPTQVAIAREESERIEREMDRLPPDYRQVLLLARVVGLPGREIARQMGRSEGAVRVLLSRATVRLLAAIEGRKG